MTLNFILEGDGAPLQPEDLDAAVVADFDLRGEEQFCE